MTKWFVWNGHWWLFMASASPITKVIFQILTHEGVKQHHLLKVLQPPAKTELVKFLEAPPCPFQQETQNMEPWALHFMSCTSWQVNWWKRHQETPRCNSNWGAFNIRALLRHHSDHTSDNSTRSFTWYLFDFTLLTEGYCHKFTNKDAPSWEGARALCYPHPLY